MEQRRDFRCGGELQPATECFSTDCGIEEGRRVSQKWGSLLSPFCSPRAASSCHISLGVSQWDKTTEPWGQKPVSFYVGHHAPATVSGLATCLWPSPASTSRKELHTEEAGTWGMSPLLLWLGLLLCVSGKEKQVRKPADRVPTRGMEFAEGR